MRKIVFTIHDKIIQNNLAMISKYKLFKIIGLTVFAFLISSCSTKKNTAITRTFHNVTARYNVYFNGKESFKSAMLNLDNNYKDNYNEILPIYKYKNKSYLTPLSSDMDKSIKKSLKVIKMHSLKAKPKRPANREMTPREREYYKKNEYCRWVDDSYFLIGKSNFYKEDYPKAINSFQHIINQFSKEDRVYDAHIWLVKTYVESNRMSDAKEQINIIKNNKKFPEKKKLNFNLAQADYYLEQQEYDKLIPLLKSSLELTKNKELKSRLSYILAQLHTIKGNKKIARDYYAAVIKMQVSYEMSFYAQINSALILDANQNSDNLEKDLLKMLKDIKNSDFQSQIYYALAKLSITKGDKPKAIEYYKLSAQSPNAEGTQKALSYLALADIYFEASNYLPSGAYYDSTMNFLDESYSRYAELSKQTRNLKVLIDNLNTIQNQDSLQKVAKMPEKDRMNIVYGIIDEIKQREAEEKQQQLSLAGNLQNQNEQGIVPISGQSGKWYFYNQTSVSYGSTDFKKRWGARKIEDNWRRSNKKIVAEDFFNNNEETGTNNESKELTDKMPEYYLQHLPLNDSSILVSNQLIAAALYNAGNVYNNKLNETELAAEIFNKLLNRFPSHEFAPQTAYKLYLIYTQQNNVMLSNRWKNYLIATFPKSTYAKVLNNPDYLEQLKAEIKQAEILYEKAYIAYENMLYSDVIELTEQAEKQFPTHELIPKFNLLHAFATARQGQIDNYISELESITKSYQGSIEAQKAQDILSNILSANSTNSQNIENAQLRKASSIFNFKPEEEHWAVFYAQNTTLDINRLRFDLFNICIDDYAKLNLKIEAETVDKMSLIVIRTFNNKNKTLAFIDHAKRSLIQLKKQEEKDFGMYIISKTNFSKLKTEGDLFLYQTFYKKFYLSK